MLDYQPDNPDTKPWVYWMRLVASSLACALVFFHRAVFTAETFVSRDIQLVYQPLRHYWAERVSRGEFPEWFPYDGLGQPFAGMLVSHAFHPSNLLSLVLSVEQSIELSILLSFPAAMVGIVALCRRLGTSQAAAALAGVLYAFSGYLVTITNNLPYLLASSALPWALWAAVRYFSRPSLLRAAMASSLLSLVLFSGDPQAFVVACAVVGVLSGLQYGHDRSLGRRFVNYAGLMALTALFSSVQIIPSLHVALANGGGSHSVVNSLSWSVHPLRLLELFLGPFFGGDGGLPHAEDISRLLLKTGNSTLWVDSIHVGVVALGFASTALAVYRGDKRAWVGVLTVLALLALALGRYGGLYELLRVFPFWKPFRYPEKLVPFLVLSVSIGASAGLDALGREPALRRRVAMLFGSLGALCFLLWLSEMWFASFAQVVVPTLWEGTRSAKALEHLTEGFTRSAGTSALVAFATTAVVLLVRDARRRGTIISLLAFTHLFVANERFYEVSLPEAISTPSATVREIERREGSARLGLPRVASAIDSFYFKEHDGMSRVDFYAASNATGLMPITPARFGLEGANTYMPASSKRIVTLEKQTRLWVTRYSGMFGARYLTVSGPFYEAIDGNAERVILEQRDVGVLLLENQTARPRAYLTRPICLSSPEEALAMVSAQRFPFDKVAAVECPPGIQLPLPSGADLGTVAIERYEPERVEVRVEAEEAALLVLADSYYSGWEAILDGAPAAILPANYALRGVAVPKGSHRVVFAYRTPWLRLAAAVSLSSLVLSVAGGLLGRRRRNS